MASQAVEILKLVGSELGEFGEYVTTTTGNTPTASVASTLVCTTLVNSNLAATELEDTAVLIESGNNLGEMRFVRKSGLARTTGTLTMADNFTNSVIAGVSFSTWSRLAPLSRLGERSVMACLNDGMRSLSVRDTIPVTGVTDQKHYTIDTTTYPWWTEEWRVIAVEYPVTNADDIPREMPRSSWSWVGDGETKKLRFRIPPAKTGETFNVRVYRPANSRLILNARLRAVITGGVVTSVTVVTGGYYSAVPTVTPASGAATFTAVLDGGTSGTITSVTVNGGGIGYPVAPALTVTRNASDTGWRDQTTQTAKLIDITDQTIADVGDAAIACKAYAYQALASMHQESSETADWEARSQRAFRSMRSMVNRRPSDPRTGIPNLRPTVMYPGGASGRRVWW